MYERFISSSMLTGIFDAASMRKYRLQASGFRRT
jgi:hypothetical protein